MSRYSKKEAIPDIILPTTLGYEDYEFTMNVENALSGDYSYRQYEPDSDGDIYEMELYISANKIKLDSNYIRQERITNKETFKPPRQFYKIENDGKTYFISIRRDSEVEDIIGNIRAKFPNLIIERWA